MVTIAADRLQALFAAVLEAVGASAHEAATVARHMVGANLAGHDSHGAQLLPTCVERVKRGDIVPGAPVAILDETASTARVDGHWGFGQVVSERAMALAIAKAQAANVAAVTVVRQGHVGRLADYPLMAARAGMVGMMFCAEVAAFARYIKETPPAPGVREVLYPGELEWRTEQERRARGIPLDEPTWAALRRLAHVFGLGKLARD